MNLYAAIRDNNIGEGSDLSEVDIKLLLTLSFGSFTLSQLATHYKQITGSKATYQHLPAYLSPLIKSGYIYKTDKLYSITPSGLLILSRLEKRLKRIR